MTKYCCCVDFASTSEFKVDARIQSSAQPLATTIATHPSTTTEAISTAESPIDVAKRQTEAAINNFVRSITSSNSHSKVGDAIETAKSAMFNALQNIKIELISNNLEINKKGKKKRL